jgi:hypothetical protein
VGEVLVGGTGRAIGRARDGVLAIGGFAQGGARLLHASGTTARGAAGSAQRAAPMIALGPELRLIATPWLALRAAAGVDVTLATRRFALNGTSVVDVGGARGTAEVGATVTPF